MSEMSIDSEFDESCIFSAKLETVGIVATLLKAIAFSEKVNVCISNSGLRFTVEEGKYVQAYVLMPKELFKEFVLNEEEVSFKIPLRELLECLKIFCSDGKVNDTHSTASNMVNTTLTLMYRSVGSQFVFLLEENGIQTDFKLKTEEIDDLMEFEIEPVKCKIIMNSDLFLTLLGEFDGNGPEVVEIAIIPREEVLVLSAKGYSGLMEVIIPAKSSVIDLYDCPPEEECRAKYRFNTLKYAFKAIQIGEKLVMKVSADGILSWSLLLPTKSDSFVEFLVIPLQGNIDDDEEEG